MVKIRMSRAGIMSGNEGEFDWENAIIDSAIAAGLSFFTTMAGLGVAGLFEEPIKGICACAISAATAFFSWLALKRGIVKEE